jgi:threonine aldolase
MHFASDNTAPISPEILEAIAKASTGKTGSYGADPLTEKFVNRINEIFETSCTVYPVATGTAANALALACLVKPYGAIICADEAHISTDECGAPEFYTSGAKLILLPSPDGRIAPMQIEQAMARAQDGGVHHVLPEAVSITQATEWGTVYAADAIAEIGETCRRRGLALHMDGARFANALVYGNASPADLTWKSGVDVLSLGATKNGAMAAEAVIFFNPALAAGFERRRKRAGQLWSKQRFLSAQLLAYVEDDLWRRNARRANATARRLADVLRAIPNVRLVQQVQANEIFAAMPEDIIDSLKSAGAVFYGWIDIPGEPNPIVRLVTSFATTDSEIDAFEMCARHATHAREPQI